MNRGVTRPLLIRGRIRHRNRRGRFVRFDVRNDGCAIRVFVEVSELGALFAQAHDQARRRRQEQPVGAVVCQSHAERPQRQSPQREAGAALQHAPPVGPQEQARKLKFIKSTGSRVNMRGVFPRPYSRRMCSLRKFCGDADVGETGRTVMVSTGLPARLTSMLTGVTGTLDVAE